MQFDKDLVEVEPGLWVTRDGRVFRESFYARGGKKDAEYQYVIASGKRYGVHRLVAKAYIDNPEGKPIVCHKDDNPKNNHVSNLFWGTQKENMLDMVAKGRDSTWTKKIPNYEPADYVAYHELVNQGLSRAEICEHLKISPYRVKTIRKRLNRWGVDVTLPREEFIAALPSAIRTVFLRTTKPAH